MLLATGAMAAAVARHEDPNSADYDCVLANRREMAADAGCGDHAGLTLCFQQLESSDPNELAECYHKAGCGGGKAASKAMEAQIRCAELFPEDAELRRRRRGDVPAPETTSPPQLASIAMADLWARSAATGDDCLTTSSKMTKVCDMKTEGDSTVTDTCSSTEVPESECAPGKTCSMDNQGNDICMDLEDTLDIAGIIIAIVFGTLIVLGIAVLTWLCCRDRKEQKRLAAKAEATALARAATKKKKAQDARAQRAPLMQEQRGRDASAGSGDPFHDQNRG